MDKNKNLQLGMLNLHDAFLQASLLKKFMENSPVIKDPKVFLISDRGRFERLWVAMLYVLVEAWGSTKMAPMREHCRSVVSLDELESLLATGKREGFLGKMQQTRHYVCHRDRREYWDDGRTGPVGNLAFNLKLHEAFSKVLLASVRKLPRAKEPGK